MEHPPRDDDEDFPRGFDAHRRAQIRRGLLLTPAQRLRWLEETMSTLRRWTGRAREGRPMHEDRQHDPQ